MVADPSRRSPLQQRSQVAIPARTHLQRPARPACLLGKAVGAASAPAGTGPLLAGCSHPLGPQRVPQKKGSSAAAGAGERSRLHGYSTKQCNATGARVALLIRRSANREFGTLSASFFLPIMLNFISCHCFTWADSCNSIDLGPNPA